MRKYFVQTFDLDFEDGFRYKKKIHNFLKQEIGSTYHPFTITLCFPDRHEETLLRPAIQEVEEPKLVKLPKRAKKPLAIAWVCKRRDRAIENKDFRGIAYKVGGITVGNKRTAGREGAKSEHGYFYDRIMGEIHVIDPEIKPDPERADFKPGEKVERLKEAVSELVAEVVAELRQDRKLLGDEKKAVSKVKRAIRKLPELKQKWSQKPTSRDELFKLFSETQRVKEELEEIKQQASGEYEREADKALREITKVLEDTALPILGNALKRPEGEPHVTKAVISKSLTSDITTAKSILECVKKAGWQIDGQAQEVLQIIDMILREIWDSEPQKYENFLARLAEKLS